MSRAEPGFTQRHPRGRCRRARDEAVRLIHPRVQRKGCQRSRTRQLREIRAISIILQPSSSCSCTTGSCPAPWVPTPNPLSLVPGCVLGLGVWPVEPSSCVPLPRGANALLSKSSSSSSSPGRAASACSQCAPSGFVPSYRRGATPWLCQGQRIPTPSSGRNNAASPLPPRSATSSLWDRDLPQGWVSQSHLLWGGCEHRHGLPWLGQHAGTAGSFWLLARPLVTFGPLRAQLGVGEP